MRSRIGRSRRTDVAPVALLLLCAACTSSSTTSQTPAGSEDPSSPTDVVGSIAGAPTDRYDDPAMWVCRGEPTDTTCTDGLATTVIAADGTTTVVDRTAATSPPADCFYVYPTVDSSREPGNASLDDTDHARLMVREQAAQFSTVCRVFAPLYEQATMGSYAELEDPARALTTEPFEHAYAQVLDAFRWYLAHDDGDRPIVLLGHSQGSQLLARLLTELFEPHPELRDRLVLAVLAGAGGTYVSTPPGASVGGTFSAIPTCTASDDTGCVLAWSSYNASVPGSARSFTGAPDGRQATCVSPTTLAGADTATATFHYPILGFGGGAPDLSTIGLGTIDTEFVTYPHFYAVGCVTDAWGTGLAVGPADPTDPRPPVPIDNRALEESGVGLHLVDYELVADDLLATVGTRIEAAAGA